MNYQRWAVSITKKVVCPVVVLKSEIKSDATRKKLLGITSVEL